MTTIGSCDHHDASGLVPSNRSRARMLEQLRAASELGARMRDAVSGVTVQLYGATERPDLAPTITLDLERFMRVWTAYQAWRLLEPSGDDWAPAFERGAEIRVPTDGDAVESS